MTLLHNPTGTSPGSGHTLAELASEFGLTISTELADRGAHTTFTGLAVGSAAVTAGKIFVALKGLKAHGANYAHQALALGAVAILTDTEGAALVVSQGLAAQTVILTPRDGTNLRELMARCAAWAHNYPSADLAVAGVTGTNGKTTTTFFLDAILRSVGQVTGLIGTIEMRLGDQHTPAVRTTVEAPVLQEFFAQAKELHVDSVCMEVSSHALSLDRVTGTRFAVVGFTNLQRDHLDFHHTMAEYYLAKASLFTEQYSRAAVINVDDEYGWQLFTECQVPAVSVATVAGGPRFASATWRVTSSEVSADGNGVDFELEGPDGDAISSHSPLLGSVNVANAALATLMAAQMGIPTDQIKAGLTELAVVPGRMEVVSQPGQPRVIVDYAHTTEALEFALSSLREQLAGTPGEVTVVFGAAGERDASKRPAMGRVTLELAHRAFVTDDDPYGEDRGAIRAQILEGARQTELFRGLTPSEQEYRLQEFGVREDAIEAAISWAGPQDTVLIAGRGHETIQDLDGVQHELDDREFARLVLAREHPLA